jgi:hypothetical protein
LIGVFSLGLITMAISFARFMIYTVSDYNLSDNDGGKFACSALFLRTIVLTLQQPSCAQPKCAPLLSLPPFRASKSSSPARSQAIPAPVLAHQVTTNRQTHHTQAAVWQRFQLACLNHCDELLLMTLNSS